MQNESQKLDELILSVNKGFTNFMLMFFLKNRIL